MLSDKELLEWIEAQPEPIDSAYPDLSRDDAIRLVELVFKFDKEYAETFISFARGETDGDVIEVDENGKRITNV